MPAFTDPSQRQHSVSLRLSHIWHRVLYSLDDLPWLVPASANLSISRFTRHPVRNSSFGLDLPGRLPTEVVVCPQSSTQNLLCVHLLGQSSLISSTVQLSRPIVSIFPHPSEPHSPLRKRVCDLQSFYRPAFTVHLIQPTWNSPWPLEPLIIDRPCRPVGRESELALSVNVEMNHLSHPSTFNLSRCLSTRESLHHSFATWLMFYRQNALALKTAALSSTKSLYQTCSFLRKRLRCVEDFSPFLRLYPTSQIGCALLTASRTTAQCRTTRCRLTHVSSVPTRFTIMSLIQSPHPRILRSPITALC